MRFRRVTITPIRKRNILRKTRFIFFRDSYRFANALRKTEFYIFVEFLIDTTNTQTIILRDPIERVECISYFVQYSRLYRI